MRNVYDFWQILMKEEVPLLCVLALSGIILAFCAGVWLTAKVVGRRRRKYRERLGHAEVERRMQYTLPQKDNGYIRERLQNELKVKGMGEELKNVYVRVGYARVLLGKVKAAPLTIAERLQTDEMSEKLTLYRGKEGWTVEEVRGFNDLCAALLKLSAKYAV